MSHSYSYTLCVPLNIDGQRIDVPEIVHGLFTVLELRLSKKDLYNVEGHLLGIQILKDHNEATIVWNSEAPEKVRKIISNYFDHLEITSNHAIANFK